MDLIEKAAEKLGRMGKSSLIEKAADRITDGAHTENDVSGPNLVENGDAGADGGEIKSKILEAEPSARYSRRVEIDLDRLRMEGFVTPDAERTRVAEEFRIIKRPLLLKAFSRDKNVVKNGHLVMVTSAKPGEGKTFTAVNLAMSIASERDLTVFLVDADVSHPSVPRIFDLSARKGLVDILDDKNFDMSDALIRTNLDNFSILPAGKVHPNSTELLASGHF